MKVMAIDFGDVRTGVAFSDLTGTLAGHNLTVTVKGRAALIAQLKALWQAEQPGRVVLGLPINMNGTHGPRAEKTQAFGRELSQALGVPVVYWDERGTSVTAGRILSDAGKKKARQRARIDAVAAAVLLQSYLDHLNFSRPTP